MQKALAFLLGQLQDATNPVSRFFWHFLIGAIGDKTSTAIGLVVGTAIQLFGNFGAFIPAPYAGYIQTALTILSIGFGAYVTTAKKGAEIHAIQPA